MTYMESTRQEPDHESDTSVVADVHSSSDVTSVSGAAPTSVGVWGPSGCGKTAFAASMLTDPGFAPCLYIDIDGGLPALEGYERADLLVHRPATFLDDVLRHVRDAQAGRITDRRGRKVRSVVVDAVSNLIPNEIGRRGLQATDPKDQAQKLIQPFKVLFGQLRELHKSHGITCVQVCHAKVKSSKPAGGGDAVEVLVPDMFASIARPWMASVRHLWRLTKMRGAKGPAYPLMMLRTEQEGQPGAANFGEYMKTSSIAFAQWIAGESGKREHLQWDTGTMPVHEQPTLAALLRVAESLAFEQGRLAATDPQTLRALANLHAAMEAADA